MIKVNTLYKISNNPLIQVLYRLPTNRKEFYNIYFGILIEIRKQINVVKEPICLVLEMSSLIFDTPDYPLPWFHYIKIAIDEQIYYLFSYQQKKEFPFDYFKFLKEIE